MNERRPFRKYGANEFGDYDRNRGRQFEQFEQRGYRGGGHQADDRHRQDQPAQMDQDYDDFDQGYSSGRNDFEEARRYSSDRPASRPTGRSYGGYASEYGRDPREYGSFTGNDFGGRDFSAPRQSRDYSMSEAGYASGGREDAYRGGASQSSRAAPYRREERGFFEKAGDEVASWFGDEEASRRREFDHSGRGPTNYTRSDERILEDVCDHITRDWAVDGRSVQVSVQNGEVTLDGTVPTRLQKRRAEDCADEVVGVGHVQNNLRVQPMSGQQQTSRESES